MKKIRSQSIKEHFFLSLRKRDICYEVNEGTKCYNQPIKQLITGHSYKFGSIFSFTITSFRSTKAENQHGN